MMAVTAALRYGAGDGWRAVELPYVGEALALTVIVPDDLASFEASLDGDGLATITGALSDRQVSLTFPRFGIETKVELADVLAAMGMPMAFSGAADFGGITDEASLYISDVIHQANIDVDEKGTEAAAATAVVMRESAGPGEPVTLHVDRPFLFALRDVPTGAVLFLGRVGDPSIATPMSIAPPDASTSSEPTAASADRPPIDTSIDAVSLSDPSPEAADALRICRVLDFGADKVSGMGRIDKARDAVRYATFTGTEPEIRTDAPAWLVAFGGEIPMPMSGEIWIDPTCIVVGGDGGFYATGPVRILSSGVTVTPLPAGQEPDLALPPLLP
jgi:hypothetical protein